MRALRSVTCGGARGRVVQLMRQRQPSAASALPGAARPAAGSPTRVEPWLYAAPALCHRHGHAGAAGRSASPTPSATCKSSTPSPAASSGSTTSATSPGRGLPPRARNTFWWTFLTVLIQLVLGLILALLLDVPFRGRGIAQALVFLPWAVPTFLTGLNWAWLFNPIDRPVAALALRARHPRRARQHPLRPRPRALGPDHRRGLVGHPLLRHHAPRRPAVDPGRPLRGRRHRRRQPACSASGRSRCPSSRRSSPSPCCCAPSGSRTSPTSSSS